MSAKITWRQDFDPGPAARPVSRHNCHWPGCTRAVPPRMWGCKPHWFALPKHLRDLIWATYRPGQEITKTPSPEYIEAANAVQARAAQESAQQGGGNE